MFWKQLLGTTAAALALGTATQAQEVIYWGEAGGWDILIDTTVGDGCLIEAEYNNGSTIRIGLLPEHGSGYVAAFNRGWGDIEHGEEYPLLFELDREEYEGEGYGVWLDGVPGVIIEFDSVDFLEDIARRNWMTFYSTEGEVMSISLDGTWVGLEGVFQCQEEIG